MSNAGQSFEELDCEFDREICSPWKVVSGLASIESPLEVGADEPAPSVFARPSHLDQLNVTSEPALIKQREQQPPF